MKKITAGIISIILSSGFFLFAAKPDGLLHVYFLNVGQGDAVLIRTPAGKNILVDGGPEKAVLEELSGVLPLFNNTLDRVILTHADRDHIEGLVYVLRRYKVSRIISTGVYKNEYFSEAFLKTAREKGIPILIADAKNDIRLDDGIFIDILFPFSQLLERVENVNAASIVAKVVYGENEILLTGDTDAATESKLLANGAALASDVLKIAHHGSKTSTTGDFLRAVAPKFAVISAGKNNKFNHPHKQTLKRLKEAGVKILRTDLDGRIEFVFSKEKLELVKSKI